VKQRWRFLHLATHGFFDPPLPSPARPKGGILPGFETQRGELTYGRNPLLASGLVLSGVNADAEKGSLSAEEVASLDLRSCELVVLSACDTGRGKVAVGEGVLGLQRGFQVAGARAVAVSLWSINDAATSVLMEEFYAQLWGKEKLSKIEALRRAQLAVLRDPARVRKRMEELRAVLVKRGVSEADLAARGFVKKAEDLPGGGKDRGGRSWPAWWAGFVLCGQGW
jgi:CHAT domain-containing protein